MQQFKGLISTCMLALLCSTASAQVTVVIDNQTIPTEHIGSISILKNTNVVSISTNVPYTVAPVVVGDDVVITSFTVTPSSIEQGDNATLNWTTENAEACTASGGVGSWDGAVAINGSQQITATEVGNPSFTLTCTGAAGDPAIRNVSLNVTLANAVAITSFSASPTSIVEGESTTLSWVTENATSCAASLGTAEWQATSIGLPGGSVPITIADSDTYTFRLTCEGIGGPVTEDATVSVTSPDDCATPALEGEIVEWQTFWSSAFPGPTYKLHETTIARTGYKALRIETADVQSLGRLQMVETTGSPITLLGAISECPGDFDVEPVCDGVWGLSRELKWSTVSDYRTCFMENNPGSTYYFNMTFTDGFDPSTTTCNENRCRTTLQHKNY